MGRDMLILENQTDVMTVTTTSILAKIKEIKIVELFCMI